VRAPAPRRAKSNTAATQEIDTLLTNKMPLLDGGADHFTLLGVARTASADEIQKTYFMLARKLHPDRLSAIGVEDDARNAQRLMAEINAAFAVLNDPAKREEYQSILARGGEAAIRAEEARVDDVAMRVMRAEEVFRQGEMALRRDQLPQAIEAFKQAVALQPNEAEYQALLAWALFASAPDKNALATPTRRALQKAVETNEKSVTARYFLGRVERMLGKEKEALEHFKDVLRIKPNHSEASSEARILEQRLKGKR
jgi:curved DNA-binding protein CbpA